MATKDVTAIKHAERRQAVLALRKRRMSYSDIAAELGMSRAAVAAEIKAAIDEYKEAEAELVHDLRRKDLEDLDALRDRYMPDATGEGGDIHAAKIVLAVLERRARMFGLDSPTQTTIATPGAPGLGVFVMPPPAASPAEWSKTIQPEPSPEPQPPTLPLLTDPA